MKFSRITIAILILTLVTVVGWVFYQVNRIQKGSVALDPIDSKYTQPLNPNLDPQLLDKLRERQ